MRIALEKLLADIPHHTSHFDIQIIDVDQDPALIELYDELVPVLFARKTTDPTSTGVGKKLCHYFLDPTQVKEFCNDEYGIAV